MGCLKEHPRNGNNMNLMENSHVNCLPRLERNNNFVYIHKIKLHTALWCGWNCDAMCFRNPSRNYQVLLGRGSKGSYSYSLIKLICDTDRMFWFWRRRLVIDTPSYGVYLIPVAAFAWKALSPEIFPKYIFSCLLSQLKIFLSEVCLFQRFIWPPILSKSGWLTTTIKPWNKITLRSLSGVAD